MKYDDYWKNICEIHLLTKHYLLLAEEMCDEGDLFLQPLKEHRDAYDHIIRVYAAKETISSPDNPEEYMRSNMSKAIGHEYRAFFDTADWLSLICRRKINVLLAGKKSEEIRAKYSKYDELKELLLSLPGQIAEQREHKDVGNDMLAEVNKYASILDSLVQKWGELYMAFDDLGIVVKEDATEEKENNKLFRGQS